MPGRLTALAPAPAKAEARMRIAPLHGKLGLSMGVPVGKDNDVRLLFASAPKRRLSHPGAVLGWLKDLSRR